MDPALSYAVGPPLPEGSYDSCWKRILDATHRFPDSLALISMHQRPDLYGVSGHGSSASYLRWTYRDLELAGERVAANLSSLGITVGTPVFTFLSNGVEYALAYWAASALGCTFIPLNVRQLEYAEELEHMVNVALQKCQSRNAVTFAANPNVALKLDGLSQLLHSFKFVIDGPTPTGWTDFENILPDRQPGLDNSCSNEPRPDEHTDSTIMFTSGTTSLPKGCHWHYPHFPSASFAIRDVAGEAFQQKNGDVTAITAPNNHAVGFFYLLMALCNGATALFPGPNFEAEAFLKAAKLEGVTHTVAVPTMIQSISDVIKTKGVVPSTLKHIMIGGAGVSAETLHQCTGVLGSEGVEVIFGMTDGVFISSGKRRPEELIQGEYVSVGWCLPGCRIKICAPGSLSPVPMGQVGELHYQSITLIENYIDRKSDDFYNEDDKLWFCTGDQAVLHPDGRLFVTGRYKEMIVRGGENISPEVIEACIARLLPHMAYLHVQVVGIADAVAGEVPLAITAQAVSEQDVAQIKQTVTNSMGKTYALDDVIPIQDLGLREFPRTMAGKIQKSKLKDLLRSYHERNQGSESSDSQLVNKVKQVWARAVGLGVQDLSLTTEIADLGDSITLMRVKDRLFKQTGVNISLEEIAKAQTIRDLVKILQARSTSYNKAESFPVPGLAGPPNAEDMVHVSKESIYKATKNDIMRTISPYGLTWSDVRDVFPAYDMTRILAQDGTLDRWSYEIRIVTKGCGVEDLAAALLKTFANNPMQASFLIWDHALLGDSIALHVTVDQNPTYLKSLLTYGGVISSVGDPKALTAKLSNAPTLPGPLTRVILYHIEEIQGAGMLYNTHHAMTDAVFIQLIFEDLDLALSGKTLRPHVPYKLYCDSLFALRDSPAAREATDYHVSKLKDLARQGPYLWPPSTLPIQDSSPENIEHTTTIAIPANLLHPPSLLLKAAFALFLLSKTHHTHALFAHLDAARDNFPFLPTSLAASSSKLRASDVGGQTLQVVTNLIPAPWSGETVRMFLHRLRMEQDEQHRNAAAPWSNITSQLGGGSAEVLSEVASRCMFNWLGNDFETQEFESFEVVSGMTRKDEGGLTVEGALSGGEMVVRVRGAVFGIEELRGIGGEIREWLGMLFDEKNWEVAVRMLMAGDGVNDMEAMVL